MMTDEEQQTGGEQCGEWGGEGERGVGEGQGRTRVGRGWGRDVVNCKDKERRGGKAGRKGGETGRLGGRYVVGGEVGKIA